MDTQIKKGYRYTKYGAILFAILSLISLPWYFVSFSTMSCLVSNISLTASIWFVYNFLDAKKNYNFYKNKKELNSTLETNNLLYGIKEKTKEMLINQPKEEQIFNYNSIDRLTYLELKRILLNLKMARRLNFKYAKSQNQFIQEEAIRRNRENEKIVSFNRSRKK